jgi:hypothetical protein
LQPAVEIEEQLGVSKLIILKHKQINISADHQRNLPFTPKKQLIESQEQRCASLKRESFCHPPLNRGMIPIM